MVTHIDIHDHDKDLLRLLQELITTVHADLVCQPFSINWIWLDLYINNIIKLC